jgi:hypothetical protein
MAVIVKGDITFIAIPPVLKKLCVIPSDDRTRRHFDCLKIRKP